MDSYEIVSIAKRSAVRNVLHFDKQTNTKAVVRRGFASFNVTEQKIKRYKKGTIVLNDATIESSC